ncbi:MAG: hypothetical protein IE933_07645 [Sphingomonadales bacterium]|nr:hypothetical protein [Sphingomonadales bacterium]MBD3773819.1 hypothetical protein [Paracoccaceae bacterium]
MTRPLYEHTKTGSLPVNTIVMANETNLELLRGAMSDRFGASYALHALSPSDPVPADILAKADLLVVEIDPNHPQSLARIAQIRDRRPDVLLVAAIRDADVAIVRTLVRRGVNDVVALPFDVEELFASIVDLSASKAGDDPRLSPLTAVVGVVGGVGATTVITHLAAAIVHANPGSRCCLIDLDLQSGDIAYLLGQGASSSVIDLLQAGDRLDDAMFRDACIDTGRGIHILSAPDHIVPPEAVDAEAVLALIALARREFDYVLVDLPADWTNWSLSAACSASHLVLLTDQSLRCLRQAKKSLELLESVDYPPRSTHLVVNRAEKRLFQSIGTQEVEKALGREVMATVALQKSGLQDAQEQAILLGDVDARAALVRDVAQIAQQLLTVER